MSVQIDKKLLELLSNEQVTQRTRVYVNNLLSEMMNAKTEEAGWRIRSELQGMINSLELQGVISAKQHSALGEAIGDAWKPLSRSFAVNRLSQVGVVS